MSCRQSIRDPQLNIESQTRKHSNDPLTHSFLFKYSDIISYASCFVSFSILRYCRYLRRISRLLPSLSQGLLCLTCSSIMSSPSYCLYPALHKSLDPVTILFHEHHMSVSMDSFLAKLNMLSLGASSLPKIPSSAIVVWHMV